MRPPGMLEIGRAEQIAVGNGFVETDPTGRYSRFDQVLGRGAVKIVYRAFDELNGTEVAWNQAKLSEVMRSPEALQRMHSEVHLLSSLSHESIIKFHASWIDAANRTFNFITEMFTSGTLREYRQRYPRVNIRTVKTWARQILQGILHLHSHDPPVIHRDLKCDNIFVNGHLGQVKIGDLGLAAMLREAHCAHSVIGTPEFMAPEVYEEEYNELVDIYSFGMCVLEMLTSEYPYSECSNPAQIYKKVTSGKLPDAFHRIRDPQAKRFIGRCLETVSKRSSAKELLHDPFLAFEDRPITSPSFKSPSHEVKNIVHGDYDPSQATDCPGATSPVAKRTDTTITGKMNPEDDTIFLKVQISDREGKMSNIYFPFDIVGDTPIDVANEMVKELDLTDREASEIAEMITQEISRLVPGWREGAAPKDCHHAYNYVEDDQDGSNHPFYCLSSPTSSQGSEFGGSSSQGIFCQHHSPRQVDWLADGVFQDDDDVSSVHSSKYSAVNYTSGGELESDGSFHRREPMQLVPSNSRCRWTRFCPEDSSAEDDSISHKLHGKCNILTETLHVGGGKRRVDSRRLMRNQSMMDVRSQLLHKALVEELNKRMFKTVGAVENIGFQMPCDGLRGSSRGDCRKKKYGPERERG
ncbi:hypothetical protein OPV22_010322 [Ensete ventricosum]|uniref:non-specific serine/threonine protein kinase n=1 Tax=Ensete ventricosum TaxID=4639 RepID=A0AAV8RD54_ENSVE|nr:hypothetical protein OPV22_010322 [Ensete ventricosum]